MLHTKEITLPVQASTPGTPHSGFASPSGAFGFSDLIKASALRLYIMALQTPAAVGRFDLARMPAASPYSTMSSFLCKVVFAGCLLPKLATRQCALLLQLPSLLNNVDVKGLIGSATLPPVTAMLIRH